MKDFAGCVWLTGGQVNDGWGRTMEKGWLADKLWVDSPHVFVCLPGGEKRSKNQERSLVYNSVRDE